MSSETAIQTQEQSWQYIRERTLERDGYECQFCGLSNAEHKQRDGGNRGLSVHHIIPRSYGGGNNLGNLITVCEPCHKTVESITEQILNSGFVLNADDARTAAEMVTADALGPEEQIIEYMEKHPTVAESYGLDTERVSSHRWLKITCEKRLEGEREFWGDIRYYQGILHGLATFCSETGLKLPTHSETVERVRD